MRKAVKFCPHLASTLSDLSVTKLRYVLAAWYIKVFLLCGSVPCVTFLSALGIYFINGIS